MVYINILGVELSEDENYFDLDEEDIEFRQQQVTIHISDGIFFIGVPYEKVKTMLEKKQIIEGMNVIVKNGLECLGNGYMGSTDPWLNFHVENFTVTTQKPEEKEDEEEDEEEEEEEDEEEEEEEKIINWNESLEVLYNYDTHYGCYCKTGPICGCGCDPLHDGW